MKKLNSLSLSLAIGLAALAPVAEGSRTTKSHALSDCVQEADIILTGLVRSGSDDGENGILQISVAKILKHPRQKDAEPPAEAARQTMSIANRSFHSKYQQTMDGPIKVKAGEAYIFFLKAPANQKYQYELFDWCDGVMQVNQPVMLEIRNQLKKAVR